ncbi:MAG: nitronate monooxygenase family protein [Eubacteriales bacterium]|nr:nitronate monooxygenase family protein [Eubacteriales bacterium]
MIMRPLVIGNKTARIPIIQGGMGVGVSRSKLAGAVAAAGGVGIISSAQIGFDEEDFLTNHQMANLRSLKKHIRLAKEQADGGLVGVNVMTALKDYEEHVRASVEAGADVVICGAGLPANLPSLVAGSDTKFAPIVSSQKAATVLLKRWDKKYQTTADFLVIEGPKAGGHLGFSKEELQKDQADALDYNLEIQKIIETVKEYEIKYHKEIPVIVAGGIFDAADIRHALELGADGVQIASRFVVTEECDAAPEYKQAYLDATLEDIRIIQSPVGMPGRAIHNDFLDRAEAHACTIPRCLGCLAKCNPSQIPYCITDALIQAVKGNTRDGLLFCGENVSRLHEMTTVPALMTELQAGFCTESQKVGA